MSIIAWFFGLAAGKAFNDIVDTIEIKMGIKKEPLTEPKAQALLDEYLQPIQDRIAQQGTDMGEQLSRHAQRLINRLDEECLAKLVSGFSQLRESSNTLLGRESLASAFRAFHDIASLPSQGRTAGFPNAQLRCLAFLGMAAVHIELPDTDDVIAEKLVAAIYADPSTAEQWIGKELVQELLKQGTSHLSSEERQVLQQLKFEANDKETDIIVGNMEGSQLQTFSPGNTDPFVHQDEDTLKVPEKKPVRELNEDTTNTISSTLQKPLIGTTLLSYSGHVGGGQAIAWSPDGKRIVSGGGDQTVQVWDVLTGTTLLIYRDDHTLVQAVAWSPDGKYIASGGFETIRVWDAENGTTLHTYQGHKSSVQQLAWSFDGEYIASTDVYDTVQIRNVTTGDIIHTRRSKKGTVAWSPVGKSIAFSNGVGDIVIYDVGTRTSPFTYKSQRLSITSLTWSPDGTRIATASTGRGYAGDSYIVDIRDARTGDILTTYHGDPSVYPSILTWSPDGTHILSVETRGILQGTLQVWDARTGDNISRISCDYATEAVAWSPDGTRIASIGTGMVQLCDVSTGTNIYNYQGHPANVDSLAWSPDGKYIASGGYDGTVQVWDAGSGTRLLVYPDGSGPIAWSPDGKCIASKGKDEIAKIWDPATGVTLLTYRGSSEALTLKALAWSPDSKYVASSFDETIYIWNATTGVLLFTCPGPSDGYIDEGTTVAWSPDGKSIAFRFDGNRVQLWDVLLKKSLFTYNGHSDRVMSIAWSPDGTLIASGGFDRSVQVWNTTNGDTVSICRGHTSSVQAVTWSPDGRHIASGAEDCEVRVWDAFTGNNVYIYHYHSDNVNAVAWSPDGTRIASASSWVYIWQAA